MPGFDPISAGIGTALQLPGIINSFIQSKKQKKAANKIVVNDPTFQESEYEKQNLANYQNAYNTGMLPGQALQQQQIIDTAAGTSANVGRNATSSAQRLALSGSIQGQQDQSMRQLGAQFGQQKMGLLGGLSQGLGRMTDQQQQVFMDKLRKAQEAQAAKNALMQASMTNKQQGFNSIANIGALAASGAMGDIGNMFGGGGGGALPPRVGNTAMSLAGGSAPVAGMGGIGMGNRPNTSGFNFNQSANPGLYNWFNPQFIRR